MSPVGTRRGCARGPTWAPSCATSAAAATPNRGSRPPRSGDLAFHDAGLEPLVDHTTQDSIAHPFVEEFTQPAV